MITDPQGRRISTTPYGTLNYRRYPLRLTLDVNMSEDELRNLLTGLWWTLGTTGRVRFLQDLTSILEHGIDSAPPLVRAIVNGYRREGMGGV